MELIQFILSTVGLTWILTMSSIFKPFRESVSKKRYFILSIKQEGKLLNLKNKIYYRFLNFLNALFGCWGCSGFWCGAFCYILLKYNLEIILFAFIGTISSVFIIGFNQFLFKK